jgi:hypothetical protein
MNILAFVLLVIAAALFAVEFFRSAWTNLVALGLALLTSGLIVQFCATHHSVTF